MTGQKKERWLGGYVRVGKGGKRTFIIDKWIRGQHFHLSTRCNTERAALKQFERFEADPYGFSPLGEGADAVRITPELVNEFGLWMRDVKRDTREWIGDVMRFLGDWSEDLARHDIRNLNLQRAVYPALDKRKTSRRHRVESLKSFCTWLRRVKGLLNAANDTTQSLPIPKALPANQRKKKAVSEAHIRAVLPLLPEATRDVLLMQLATAFHISEVRRFAATGDLIYYRTGSLLASVTVKHKSGELVTQPIIHAEHLAAVERIKKRGGIPIPETLCNHMRHAINQLRRDEELRGVPEQDRTPHFRLGQMRHTALSFAANAGVPLEQVAAFAHHRSIATTRAFYVEMAKPGISVPVLRLVADEKPKKDSA